MSFTWNHIQGQTPKVYDCAYCNTKVGPDKGWHSNTGTYVYVCGNCSHATYFWNNLQFPGPKFGGKVKHLPPDIDTLYEESRSAMSAQAFTPAVLACRKILMNVAVHLRAKEGQSFVAYVNYLADQGYIPPNGRHWVDHIRTKSNEANHEIALMAKDEAETLMTLTEMMLKFIYELPQSIPLPSKP